MSNKLPKIDVRERQDLVKKLKELILKYCPQWKSYEELSKDTYVNALVGIFSNMTGSIIDRLNKSPDKNFITFLNMIGVSPAPARIAKAPLVFKLREDWDRDGFIPKGSKVSAQPPNKEEVIFETEKDLTVIKPTIVRAVSIEPEDDSYKDHADFFSSQPSNTEEKIFNGDTPVDHRLYLAHKGLFKVEEPRKVCIEIVTENGVEFPHLSWYSFDKDGNPCKINSEVNGNVVLLSGFKEVEKKTLSWYDKKGLMHSYEDYFIYGELQSDDLFDAQGNFTKAQALENMPGIKSIKIYNQSDENSIDDKKKLCPKIVITQNNSVFKVISEEIITSGKGFKPFVSGEDLDKTFYIAFDSDISSKPITLFFPLTGNQLGENPIIAWEYWNGTRWLTLNVEDYTRNFTRRENLEFTAPQDIKKCELFGTQYYWIRGRLDIGGYITYPQMSTIYSNVVWAKNSNSIKDEILGSSNGEGSETFQLSRSQVLEGQSLFVQEISGKGDFIEWEEVKTFYLSESGSRHYMLDRNTGAVTFGDGKSGMIPPAGVDNIKCSYKFGGGVNGNVEAQSITTMWDNFPEIDSVTNPVAADGGFEHETADQAKIRGPYTLKTQDRGVTCEDIEWLAREAVPNISKVRCIPTSDRNLDFALGKAALIIVPESSDIKPLPSQELLSEIEEYLSLRIPTVASFGNSPGIDVTGPDYIRVDVDAKVTYTNPQSSKIIEGRILENLKQFFNPIRGGPQKSGWEFGRNVYASEVYAVIKNTPGVDYITSASVKASVQCLTLSIDEMAEGVHYAPNVTYPKLSEVRSADNRIVLGLAKPLAAKKAIKTIMVKGFEENNKVLLRYGERSEEVYILSIDGDVLQCTTVSGSALKGDFPTGSDIEYQVNDDLRIRSFILNQVTGNPETFYIKIALFEPRDIVLLVRSDEYVNTTPLKVKKVDGEDVFLEENQLVYSGNHYINKKTPLKFPYLLDTRKNILHDLNCTAPDCYLGQMDNEEKLYMQKIPDTKGVSMCKACFPLTYES